MCRPDPGISGSLGPEHAGTNNTRPFFIGVDSDGTVFDSMGIKHTRVFQPLAIEIWGLEAVAERYSEIAESINLYSHHRGINRFAGLAMVFERITASSDAARRLLEGWQDLRDFVALGVPLSAESLADYNSSKPSAFLNRVLDWSRRCDDAYAQIMEEMGNEPFPMVSATLESASKRADIAVISSSSRESLLQDWGNAGLLGLASRVAGQEMGDKVTQLQTTLNDGGFAAGHALMVGDALGDLEAAREAGILFFPILPGSEENSWQRLQSEALPRFFSGAYAGDYQRELLVPFETLLRAEDRAAGN